MDFVFTQNFLRGFGVRLNDRGIRIATVNINASREAFRSQLLDMASTVLNLYWDYVSASDELKLREHALAITQKFRDDTKYEISVGAIAGVELPRAEAEVASRRQDVVIAQANLRQRAVSLKDALSHTRRSGPRSRGDHPARPHRGPRVRVSAASARTGGHRDGQAA